LDRNSFLAVLLSMLVFTTWLMWKSSQLPPETETPPESPTAATEVTPEVLRTDSPPSTPAPADSADEVASTPAARDEGVPAWTRTLSNDLVEVTLTNLGAAVSEWTLLGYEEFLEDGNRLVQLVPDDPRSGSVLLTPFDELGLGDLSTRRWVVEAEGPHSVTFVVQQSGTLVRKTYRIDQAGYGFSLIVTVENGGTGNLTPLFTVTWPVAVREGQDFVEQSLAALTEDGVERAPVASIGSPGFFDAFVGGAPDEPLRGVEWTGVDTKYFLAALLPDRTRDAILEFLPIVKDVSGLWLLQFAPSVLPPGQKLSHELRGFVGPKIQSELMAVDPLLEHSVNRGWSWMAPLTRFFEWMLHAIYTFIPNYGLAIILLTIMVRIVTIPIMGRQMKSMERMRAVQPQLKELQAKYADDRQKQSEAMMALYKKEGVNPLGGCLPMLLQFPVFIGLFYALQSSFDLRHADFALWITDLSAPESLFTIPGLDLPFRVLPLIMGASMVLQQKLTPTTVDPAQARMMMTMMPIMFTVLFYQFPSGLVLYWMVSNFLGIAHQLWVGRTMKKG
jgi:YidC/Oxa1 family membrane protein insertase